MLVPYKSKSKIVVWNFRRLIRSTSRCYWTNRLITVQESRGSDSAKELLSNPFYIPEIEDVRSSASCRCILRASRFYSRMAASSKRAKGFFDTLRSWTCSCRILCLQSVWVYIYITAQKAIVTSGKMDLPHQVHAFCAGSRLSLACSEKHWER